MTQPWPGPPPNWQAPAQPQPPDTRRRRPSAWWFALPITLMVLAAVAFPLLLWNALHGILRTDGPVPVDGRPHQIALAESGPHLLWVTSGPAPSCAVTENGDALPLRPPTADLERTTDGRRERGGEAFDSQGRRVEVTCTGAGGLVRVGPEPSVRGFFGGIAAAIVVPLALGSIGLVLLIVLVVLFATGRPRRPPAAPDAPPMANPPGWSGNPTG